LAVDDPLWQLFLAVADKGTAAWPALAAALDPPLVAMAKNQPLGRLRADEDTPREIVARVLARLHRNDFEAIRKISGVTPQPNVMAFLFVLVRRSAIDYMRASPEFARGNAERPPGAGFARGPPPPPRPAGSLSRPSPRMPSPRRTASVKSARSCSHS
jgi:hypothetical protein